MSPTEPSPDERLRALQDWLGQYEDDDPAREKIAAEAKKTAQILEKLHELDKLKESLGNKRGLQDIAEALRQQMTALLGQQVKDKVRDLGVPESQPLSQELNETYFLDDGNSTRIGNDLNAFDGKEEGREKRWKELKATGEDKVEPGTRARISTGQEMLWKNYLRTASDILYTAGFPVKTETGRFSSSRTLEILKGIADGTIKKSEDVKRPKRKKPTPNPEPPLPAPVPGPSPIPKPPEPTPPKPLPKPEPEPVVPPAPHPNPLPRGEGTEPPPEPAPPVGGGEPPAPTESHETPPETPTFARYLTEILASPERNNFIKRLTSANGRLWIDKKTLDGKTIRIWLYLDLTLEERAKPEEELIRIIEGKLQGENMSLRARIDDLSTGNSWKEKWNGKKQDILPFVTKIKDAPDTERKKLCEDLAQKLLGTDPTQEKKKAVFVTLLQGYLAKEGTSDIWTHARNALWHTDTWGSVGEAQAKLQAQGITFTPPTYERAHIKEWEKIADIEGRTGDLLTQDGIDAIKTKRITLRSGQGEEQSVTLKGWRDVAGKGRHLVVKLASGAGGFIAETKLRVCLQQKKKTDGTWEPTGEFELLAYEILTALPPEQSSPTPKDASPKPPPKPATPVKAPPEPPAPKGPATPLPPKGKKGGPDTTPPKPPVVEAGKSVKSPEIPSLGRLSFEKFLDWVRKGNLRSISDNAIYSDFLTTPQTEKYKGKDMPKDYEKNYEKLLEEEREKLEKTFGEKTGRKVLQTYRSDGWLEANFHEGLPKDKPHGRFYLNIKPDRLVWMYGKLCTAIAAHTPSINIRLKVVDAGFLPDALNRPDKAVIYFAENQAGEVLDVLESISTGNQDAFDEEIPRFTASLQTKERKTIKGIGFGESSDRALAKHYGGDHLSFNELRALALKKVLLHQHWSPSRPQDIDTTAAYNTFRDICKQEDTRIDPDLPFLNAGTLNKKNAEGKSLFAGIRTRLGM